MIETTKAFKVGDQSFLTLEDAQRFELKESLDGACSHNATGLSTDEVLSWLIQKKDVVIDILTTTKTSKPKARRIHGGTKVRKATPLVAPAPPASV